MVFSPVHLKKSSWNIRTLHLKEGYVFIILCTSGSFLGKNNILDNIFLIFGFFIHLQLNVLFKTNDQHLQPDFFHLVLLIQIVLNLVSILTLKCHVTFLIIWSSPERNRWNFTSIFTTQWIYLTGWLLQYNIEML